MSLLCFICLPSYFPSRCTAEKACAALVELEEEEQLLLSAFPQVQFIPAAEEEGEINQSLTHSPTHTPPTPSFHALCSLSLSFICVEVAWSGGWLMSSCTCIIEWIELHWIFFFLSSPSYAKLRSLMLALSIAPPFDGTPICFPPPPPPLSLDYI